jgi:hypothetical protein
MGEVDLAASAGVASAGEDSEGWLSVEWPASGTSAPGSLGRPGFLGVAALGIKSVLFKSSNLFKHSNAGERGESGGKIGDMQRSFRWIACGPIPFKPPGNTETTTGLVQPSQ